MIWLYIYMAMAYAVSLYGALQAGYMYKQNKGMGLYLFAAFVIGLFWPVVIIDSLICCLNNKST